MGLKGGEEDRKLQLPRCMSTTTQKQWLSRHYLDVFNLQNTSSFVEAITARSSKTVHFGLVGLGEVVDDSNARVQWVRTWISCLEQIRVSNQNAEDLALLKTAVENGDENQMKIPFLRLQQQERLAYDQLDALLAAKEAEDAKEKQRLADEQAEREAEAELANRLAKAKAKVAKAKVTAELAGAEVRCVKADAKLAEANAELLAENAATRLAEAEAELEQVKAEAGGAEVEGGPAKGKGKGGKGRGGKGKGKKEKGAKAIIMIAEAEIAASRSELEDVKARLAQAELDELEAELDF